MASENQKSPIYMESFEEDAIDLTEVHAPLLSQRKGVTFPGVFLFLLICGLGLILGYYISFRKELEEMGFIAELREQGAVIQTVSNDPEWINSLKSSAHINTGYFETIWTAELYTFDVTDEDLKRLSKCQRLSKLILSSDEVTAAGIKHLTNAPNLRGISFIDCPKLTRSDAMGLRKLIPNAKVAFRGNGFLGIYLSGNGGTNQVRYVVEDSPATDAGILPGDRFLSVDGVAVQTRIDVFEQLERHKAGETVKFEVLREKETVTLEVTFASSRERLRHKR